MTIDVRILTDEWYPVFEVFKRVGSDDNRKIYKISEDLFDRYVKSIEDFSEMQEELRKIVDKDD